MSKCPVCDSRKVARVSIFKNEFLCKKCSSTLRLTRKGQSSNIAEYLPGAILLALMLLPFVTGTSIFFYIAIGLFFLLVPLYFLLGRRVAYKKR